MNIVVVGGGTKGKFGNDFVLKARANGHNVAIISHQPNGDNDPQQTVADFREVSQVRRAFQIATAGFDQLDIMLYNTNGRAYPVLAEHYTANKEYYDNKIEFFYHESLKVHVIIPHVLAIECQQKMRPGSKIIFMTSGLAFDFVSKKYTEQGGYAGAKAYQLHFMKGFAHNNNQGLIVSAITTEFLYNDPASYKITLDRLYDHIIKHGSAFNGKIVATDGKTPRLRFFNVNFDSFFHSQVDTE